MMPPGFARTLLISLRWEWLRLRQWSPSWLFGSLVTVAGLAFGYGEPNLGHDPLFEPLRLSMFLTLPIALWGWYASTATAVNAFREPILVRSVNETAWHAGRVVASGTYGTLLSLGFVMATWVARPAAIRVAPDVLRWVPHIFGAYTVSAGLGGLVAMWTGAFAGPLAVSALWVAWHAAAPVLAPAAPDLLLRNLRWNPIFRDGAPEAIYSAQIAAYGTALVLLLLLSSISMRIRGRFELPGLPVGRGHYAKWLVVAVACSVLWLGKAHVAETRLTLLAVPDIPERQAKYRADIRWVPEQLQLKIDSGGHSQTVHGPMGPQVFERHRQQPLEPYIGRYGVLLPTADLLGTTSYELQIEVPDGWFVLGCETSLSTVHAETVRCAGEQGGRDWLLILRKDSVQVARELVQQLHPWQAAANERFDMLVTETFSLLEIPVQPQSIPGMAVPIPTWLNRSVVAPHRVSVPPSLEDEPLHLRRQIYGVALALTAYLIDLREPWPSTVLVGTGGMAQVPLALLATIDRLLLTLEPTAVIQGEASQRQHGPSEDAELLSVPLMHLGEFNHWWVVLDRHLRDDPDGDVHLWQTLGHARRSGLMDQWPEMLGELTPGIEKP